MLLRQALADVRPQTPTLLEVDAHHGLAQPQQPRPQAHHDDAGQLGREAQMRALLVMHQLQQMSH